MSKKWLKYTSSSRFPVVFVGGSRASSRYIPWYTRLQNGLIGQKAFSGRLNPLRTFCAFFKTFYPVTSDLWGKEVFCLDLACVARQQDGAPSLYSSPVPFLDLLSPSLLPALNSSPQTLLELEQLKLSAYTSKSLAPKWSLATKWSLAPKWSLAGDVKPPHPI